MIQQLNIYSGIYISLSQKKTLILKDKYTPIFVSALFIIAKIWKLPKCPSTDEWIRNI